jgi:outer membrane protein OmpA-like peptidoglycan-associated protein
MLLAQEITPKTEIFAGYSWLDPGGRLPAIGYDISGNPNFNVPGIPKGWGLAGTYNFNKWFGLTADLGGHYGDAVKVHPVLFGPQLRLRGEQISAFGQVLAGFSHIEPAGTPVKTPFTYALGGGIDLQPWQKIGIRIFQVDWLRTQYNPDDAVRNFRWNGTRIQGGLVFNLGQIEKPLPVSAACAAQPTEIMAGEPVKVTVTPTNFNPKRTLSYTYNATGGKVSGTETTATVDTNGLAPGNYTVTGKVTDDRKGKNQAVAQCTANFTVKEPPKNPPTISCAANPTSVKVGDPITVSSQANSPDGRPITYSYTASAGRVNGSGAQVQVDTAGAQAGPVTVTCTATDDRGLTANSTATANIEEPPPPPPQASKINEITYPDTKKPARVDNAAKAILDDVALRLQREADAKAVVVGYEDPSEAKLARAARVKDLAAQRAVNTKQYLVEDKGIDPSRIEVRKSSDAGSKSEVWIVPAGANFTVQNTTVVDENVVKAPKAPKAPARRR